MKEIQILQGKQRATERQERIYRGGKSSSSSRETSGLRDVRQSGGSLSLSLSSAR